MIIQTAIPDNATIQHAANQDYLGFYNEEIAIRELFRYPPFHHMAKLLFSGENVKQTQETAEQFRQMLIQHLPPQFEFNPVVPCGYTKIKDQYRYQFLMRGPTMYPLNHALQIIREKYPLPRKMKLFVDVNPSSTFF